jgi:hypothetical protein
MENQNKHIFARLESTTCGQILYTIETSDEWDEFTLVTRAETEGRISTLSATFSTLESAQKAMHSADPHKVAKEMYCLMGENVAEEESDFLDHFMGNLNQEGRV